jgi:hypothetical protein
MRLSALALWLGLVWAGTSSPAAAATTHKAPAPKAAAHKAKPKAKVPAPAPVEPSQEAAKVIDWIMASGDNRDLPFIVIDKTAAEVFVYGADGELKSAGAALLGLATGDNSTPGVGDRELSDIAPEDRTTPAGRFLAGFGPSGEGKKVLWVDYATAISMHPVITTHPAEKRPQRLKSPTPDDNRITFGCINVSASFYKKVVLPTVGDGNAVVYILPETMPVEEAFPAMQTQIAAAAAP